MTFFSTLSPGRRLLSGLVLAGLLWLLPITGQAEDVSSTSLVTASQGFDLNSLFDGNRYTGSRGRDHATITLAHPEGLTGAYLNFDWEYHSFTVTETATGESHILGLEHYLHTYVDLQAVFGHPVQEVRFGFHSGAVPLLEISLFTSGPLPDWVQRWQPPADGSADLLLLSAHSDDEQLFFAGMLPYYAGELGYRVQVAYLTNHRNISHQRCHEALDGLWAVGVRQYPIFGDFGDYYSTRLNDAINSYTYQGVSQETLLDYAVTLLRRFRPLVAVSHDLQGEYGHGAHMLCAQLLTQAAEISHDENTFPDSAGKYGCWETPKIYLHLYENNPILLDYDRPLERFGGMTAFQVSKTLGFPCHVSQVPDFQWYYYGAQKATDISKYSPCQFGLWFSSVGADVEKHDLFEHISPDFREKIQ